MIVILENAQRGRIVQMAKDNKWRLLDTSHPHYLSEIRQWDYGLVLLSAEEGRGVDTRFKKSAHVVILA